MSENNQNGLMVLPGPPDLSVEFQCLGGTFFKADHRTAFSRVWSFLEERLDNQHSAKERLRVAMNAILDDLEFRHEKTKRIYTAQHLQWRVEFYDMYANDGKQPMGAFIAFTGILNVALERPAELSSFIVRSVAETEFSDQPLSYADVNDGIAYCFGFMISPGRATTSGEYVDVSRLKDAQSAQPHFNPDNWISEDWVQRIVEHFTPNDQNKESQVSEQQAPAEQESDGKQTTYYGRHALSMLLQETADPSDLINVEKFIDDQLSAWSKHLALNTHKKQTENTPRFSIHEGPGIITILLDRSDLEFGERAPQLQMIFTDGANGIAITPRQQGGMTASRMLDAFDQILLELNSGKRVAFNAVDQVVTFVDQVSDHTDSLAFREAIGEPKQALIQAGVENPSVAFYMYRTAMNEKKIVVEAHFDRRDGSEAGVLFTIWLEDIGHQGNLMLKVAADSPKLPALVANHAMAEELSKAEGTREELAPVWQEVRETPADPDSVLQKLPPSGALKEALAYATSIKEFHLTGSDQAMLKHVLARFRNEGNLSNADSLALDAAENFIFAGGLLNIGDWEYEASLTNARGEHELSLLRGDNNAYIIILANGSNVPVLTFQCKVNNAQQQ